MIRASISPVSRGTSRAAARSPTFSVSPVPVSTMRKIGAGSGPGQATGRASASPSSSLPIRSMTVTSGSGGGGDKAPVGGARDRSRNARCCAACRAVPGDCRAPRPKARAISRLPTADGLSRMKSSSSAAEGRSPRRLRCSPDQRDFTNERIDFAHCAGLRPRPHPASCSEFVAGGSRLSPGKRRRFDVLAAFIVSRAGTSGRGVFAVDRCAGLRCRCLAAVFFAVLVFFVTSVERHSWRPLPAAFAADFGGLASPLLAFVALRREQRQCLVEGEGVGIGVARQRGDNSVMADIGAVAAAIEADRAAFGVRPDFAQQLRPAALRRMSASASSTTARFSPIVSTSSSAPSELKVVPCLIYGAEPADAGDDRLAGFGMAAELARQREQPQRGLEIDIGRLERRAAARPASASRRCRFAELDIVAVGALLQRDRQAGPGIGAERGFGERSASASLSTASGLV